MTNSELLDSIIFLSIEDCFITDSSIDLLEKNYDNILSCIKTESNEFFLAKFTMVSIGVLYNANTSKIASPNLIKSAHRYLLNSYKSLETDSIFNSHFKSVKMIKVIRKILGQEKELSKIPFIRDFVINMVLNQKETISSNELPEFSSFCLNLISDHRPNIANLGYNSLKKIMKLSLKCDWRESNRCNAFFETLIRIHSIDPINLEIHFEILKILTDFYQDSTRPNEQLVERILNEMIFHPTKDDLINYFVIFENIRLAENPALIKYYKKFSSLLETILLSPRTNKQNLKLSELGVKILEIYYNLLKKIDERCIESNLSTIVCAIDYYYWEVSGKVQDDKRFLLFKAILAECCKRSKRCDEAISDISKEHKYMKIFLF